MFYYQILATLNGHHIELHTKVINAAVFNQIAN